MRAGHDYEQYAMECKRWAANAGTDAERKTYLEMAEAWKRVALVQADVRRQSEFEIAFAERTTH